MTNTNKEIERKFVVNQDFWAPRDSFYHQIRQGYLNKEQTRTVRVRSVTKYVGGRRRSTGYLTVKGITVGIERDEWEYEIPIEDADRMLDELCLKPLIEKTRYLQSYEGHMWSIDVFHGQYEGRVVAEIELKSADETFAAPKWLGVEVSDNAAYYNSNM